MGAKKFSYDAIKVQQRPAALPFYLIGAPARELTKWADAPHKKASLRAGYQRELEDRRLDAIESFLESSPQNILPSAALIAVQESNFSSTEEVDGRCQVTISIDEVEEAVLREQVAQQLEERLSEDELLSVSVLEGAETEEVGTDEDDADPESVAPDSYMATIYFELKQYENLPPERQADIMEFVHTMSVPGLIMDGQHRIFGAKEAVEEINLPVVLIPGLPLSEQVFNFYVLNNKAKPLDKRQLRSIISTSLTSGEISDLYERFRKSGLNADEAQWTYRVNTDAASPFRGLISLKLEGDTAPIDDNVMDQVVSRFVKLPKTYDSLKKDLDFDWDRTKNYDRKLELFYSLWSAVRDQFPNAWDIAKSGPKQGQLFQKVALLQLQEYVLGLLKQVVLFQEESPLSSPESLYADTRTSVKRIPEEFFLKEWKKKGLDTTPGRSLWLEQLTKVVAADGKNLGNFQLFKSE
ncbi:DGQHR domain-containing protein [Mycolicibacterium elephantis]|uniref:DGQHR domain-containing protein n=1 Tax=Mycolicibacterium elephantis TaxID=81858 RepID=UPI003A888AE3